MTNADCIRRMSDDQLYDFLSDWECGDIDYSITFCDLCKQGGNELNLDCDGCRKHWLQRDAVDVGGLMYWKWNTTFTAFIADTPQTDSHITCYGTCTDKCGAYENGDCTLNAKKADTPQTESLEQFRVGLEYHTDATHFGRAKGKSVTTDTADTPQTDCDKCIWNVCNYNRVDWDADIPQTLPKDIVQPCGDGNVMMSEDTYEELLQTEQTDCPWK